MLTAKQKRDIARQAVGMKFPLDQVLLPNLINDVDNYIQKGNMNPKDKLYMFVPQEIKNQ